MGQKQDAYARIALPICGPAAYSTWIYSTTYLANLRSLLCIVHSDILRRISHICHYVDFWRYELTYVPATRFYQPATLSVRPTALLRPSTTAGYRIANHS